MKMMTVLLMLIAYSGCIRTRAVEVRSPNGCVRWAEPRGGRLGFCPQGVYLTELTPKKWAGYPQSMPGQRF